MIRLFLADVDGCLTDGVYHTDDNGKISKSFYSRDFHGMQQLHKSGVAVGIVSMSSDKVIVRQCYRCAAYIELEVGAKDKVKAVQERFLTDYNKDEVAYIGDEVFDIPLLEMVGLAACPSDAHSEVISKLTHSDNGVVLNNPGGRGCVREFTDMVLEINRMEDR